jgi:hypothetical protein
MGIPSPAISHFGPRFLDPEHQGAHEWPQSNCSHLREAEQGRWKTPGFVTAPDVANAASNHVDGNRRGTAAEETGYDQSCEAIGKCRAKKQQLKRDVCELYDVRVCVLLKKTGSNSYKIPWHAALALC